MMRGPSIILVDVWKYYRTKMGMVAALKGVNMLVFRGEVVGIYGPSGSGKTTLLKIIAGLEKVDRGEVVVEGYVLNELSGETLAMIRNTVVGYIPQDYGLIEDMTVYENIELPLLIAGVEHSEREKVINELIDYLDLRGKEKQRVKFLSGGEKQRVAIARALANTPSIILADEPTANLDWETAERVLSIFRRINEDFKTTIIIVTHDPRVLNYTERVWELREGILREVRHQS